MVAESEVALHFDAARGKDVDVDVQFRSPKHAMLMPVWLTDAQDVARSHEGWEIERFIAGVSNDDVNVDDGFGGEVRDRGRPYVLDGECLVTERFLNGLRVRLKSVGP